MPRKTQGLEQSNGIPKLNKMAESGKRQLKGRKRTPR
jgi:hypothetical protein